MTVGKKLRYLETHHPYLSTTTNYKTHRNRGLRFSRGWQYLLDIYKDQSPRMLIKKSTQCGISEYLIVRLLTDTMGGDNVFYVLPTFQLKNRFVQNRVDRSVAYSGWRESQEGRTIGTNPFGGNLSLKFFGKGSVTFGGSNTTSIFTEYPADVLIIDESEECNQDNLAMAVERLSASENRREIRVGIPTVANRVGGMDEGFKESDQKEWTITCGNCGAGLVLDWFSHVVTEAREGGYLLLDEGWQDGGERDVAVFCDQCNEEVDRFGRGRWVAQNPGSRTSGYHISKLFSTTMTVAELWERFREGLVRPIVMQRFYNGDLGLAYTAPGAQISRDVLDGALRDYPAAAPKEGRCVMGVDVGAVLNVWIAQAVPDEEARIRLKTVFLGTVRELDDVEQLWRQYRCIGGVIDALPEERMSRRAVARLRGMFRCYYAKTRQDTVNKDKRVLAVQRTPALDAVKEHLMTGLLELPTSARAVPGFYDQMTAGTRTWDEASSSYIWDEGSRPDHYHHAGAYMILARNLLVSAM